MNFSQIAELVHPVSRADPARLGYKSIKYVDIASIDRDTKNVSSASDIDASSAPSRARQQLITDDVLVSTVRPNLNAVAMVRSYLNGAIGSTGFCVLRADTKLVLPDFLFYFCQTGSFVSHLTGIANGASYPAVTDDDVLNTRIPLPSVTEQGRLARVLKNADDLRHMRRYALELSDTLLPAAFLELFGDPLSDKTNWPTESLGILGTLDRGRSRHRPRNAPHLYGGPYPFIQTGDVANARRRILKHHQTYSEAGLQQSALWPTGTLCITIAANIADAAVLTYPACFPDSVVGFTPGPRVTVEYIQFWLQFLQSAIQQNAPEVAQKNINLEILSELRCPVPPISLQQKFVSIVERHDKLRDSHIETLRQADHLFQTLLHQAFSAQ
jgi:type I restriction enzyme S subunit